MRLFALNCASPSVLTVVPLVPQHLARWQPPSRIKKGRVERASTAQNQWHHHHHRRRGLARIASTASSGDDDDDKTSTTSDSLLFDSLAAAFALSCAVTSGLSPTTGARGLVTTRRVGPGETLLAVDRSAALVVADDGIEVDDDDDGGGGLLSSSFAAEALEEFQMFHGDFPADLSRFLKSGNRKIGWFPRLCALLMWATQAEDGPSKKVKNGGGGPFSAYASLLPVPDRELGLLLNFDEREAELLLPEELREVSAREREALRRSVHDRWFSSPPSKDSRSTSSSTSPGGGGGGGGEEEEELFDLAFLAPQGFESTLAAASLVNSRCFAEVAPFPGEGGGAGGGGKRKAFQPLSLVVPLCDFANHDASAPSATFRLSPPPSDDGGSSSSSSCFELVATRAMQKGEEVTISYLGGAGNATATSFHSSTSPLLKDSTGMLRAYGFVTPGNPADRLRSLAEAGEEIAKTTTTMMMNKEEGRASTTRGIVAAAAEALSSRTRDAAERRRISAAAASIAEGIAAVGNSYYGEKGGGGNSATSTLTTTTKTTSLDLESLVSRLEREASEAKRAEERAHELAASAVVSSARADAAASWWAERAELARCGAEVLREVFVALSTKK